MGSRSKLSCKTYSYRCRYCKKSWEGTWERGEPHRICIWCGRLQGEGVREVARVGVLKADSVVKVRVVKRPKVRTVMVRVRRRES